ncbi:hypothetical protein [Sphingomonas oryzagri]
MKTIRIVAAVSAALSLVAGANVAVAQTSATASTGHYEWRAAPQVGPRAPFAAPRRVWVSAGGQVASCDCAMMKANASDCMAMGHGMAAPASPAAVG